MSRPNVRNLVDTLIAPYQGKGGGVFHILFTALEAVADVCDSAVHNGEILYNLGKRVDALWLEKIDREKASGKVPADELLQCFKDADTLKRLLKTIGDPATCSGRPETPGCGEPILWAHTKNRHASGARKGHPKAIPLNPDGTPHHGTCANADGFRDSKKPAAGP
jgi:hypothetical protein